MWLRAAGWTVGAGLLGLAVVAAVA